MPISIVCAGCEKKLKAPDTAAGKKMRCPACKAVIAVPEADDFVEPDEEIAVPEAPLPATKEVAPEKGSPQESEAEGDGNYGLDQKDEDEREARRRERERALKQKFRDDEKARRRSYKPHHAGGIKARGILSILICIFLPGSLYLAMVAINMANEDLAEMSAGRTDPSGRGAVQSGKIIAIIGAVSSVIATIVAVVWLIWGT